MHRTHAPSTRPPRPRRRARGPDGDRAARRRHRPLSTRAQPLLRRDRERRPARDHRCRAGCRGGGRGRGASRPRSQACGGARGRRRDGQRPVPRPRAGLGVLGARRGDQADDLEVESARSSKPGQSFYDGQAIDEGFGYVETRDGTTLSVNVVLPGPIEDGPYPTVVEYSGYDPSNPLAKGILGSDHRSHAALRFPPDAVQGARPAGVAAGLGHGVRRRGGQRPRHRLLGWRLRLLRGAAGPRRLRRHRGRRRPGLGARQPRRDGRALLSRDLPALRGAVAPAEPRRHHPAVGLRRHGHRGAAPRRHPQHRLRDLVGRPGARQRRALRHGVGAAGHRRRRHHLRGQPAPPAPERRRRPEGARQPLLHRRRRRSARHPPVRR